MILVIVESPAKAKKIQGFLGSDYVVRSSVGHIRDMPNKEMAVDIDNNFKPKYQISKDKQKIVSELKRLAKQASKVYLATDGDREGEAIAWHLIEVLGIPIDSPRVVFYEITQQEITKVMSSPAGILDMNMVNAQQARRVLDRLVGFEISPILWKKVLGAKSAGRVQSPVTRIIVDRENDIKSFATSSEYKIRVIAINDGLEFSANIISDKALNKQEATDALKRFDNSNLVVVDVIKKPIIRKPQPPLITSTYQQVISGALGLSPKQAMSVAQKLYMDGLITYMRTDSPALSQEAIDEANQVISAQYGNKYSQKRQFKAKGGSAQEAHEAIRPTVLSNASIDGSDIEKKVYQIIRDRVIASQMADAKLEQTTINFSINGLKAQSKGNTLVFDGFLKLANIAEDDILPHVKTGDNIKTIKVLAIEGFKKPKPRFTEASLVKKLEDLGIGRPSTFASMIDTVQQRGYVVKKSIVGQKVSAVTLTLENGQITSSTRQETIGADKNKLFPSQTAYELIKFMFTYFDDVIDYDFTASLEKQFDKIALGVVSWTDMMHEFYDDFHSKVNIALDQAEDTPAEQESIIGVCPTTQAAITIGNGKYGHFVKLATNPPKLSNIPKHINYKNIDLNTALLLLLLPKKLGQYLDHDIIATYGKNGGYLKCNNQYINLKNGEPEQIKLSAALVLFEQKTKELSNAPLCAACKSPLVIKNGKFGRFYSCTNYPKCKHKQTIKPKKI